MSIYFYNDNESRTKALNFEEVNRFSKFSVKRFKKVEQISSCMFIKISNASGFQIPGK